MKLYRPASVLLLTLASACGGGHESSSHETKVATAPEAVPTPDTTPVKALRTPAGMVLKTADATPTPEPSK